MRKKQAPKNRQLSESGSRTAAPSGAATLQPHERLAVNLRRILRSKRISEQKLADLTGYKLRFVREILGGRSARLKMRGIEKIAAVLGVRIESLVGSRVSAGA
jgi:DNA-binding Xre family transcriptional regulator